MTPFMMRVAEALGEDVDPDDLPTVATRPAVVRPVGKGNDLQIAYRGLTEQLVCEVNALLADEDDHMSLVDEIVGNEMMFSVYYRGRAAVVSTVFGGRSRQHRAARTGRTRISAGPSPTPPSGVGHPAPPGALVRRFRHLSRR